MNYLYHFTHARIIFVTLHTHELPVSLYTCMNHLNNFTYARITYVIEYTQKSPDHPEHLST